MANVEQIKKIVNMPIPKSLIETRKAGNGPALKYISGSTVTEMLNEAFGYDGWSWTIEHSWVEKSQDKPIKDRNTYKVTGHEPQPPVCHVRGILTAYIDMDDRSHRVIRKEGFGSKILLGGASEQESSFKAASTDALKKAASLFGIGLELYRKDKKPFSSFLPKPSPWDKAKKDLAEMKSLREKLNLLDDNEFITTIMEFTSDQNADKSSITPDNIKEFVKFLKSK